MKGGATARAGRRAAWVAPVAVALVGLAVGGALFAAARSSPDPPRCGAGLVAAGPRCCGAGQSFDGSHCSGPARSCAAPLVLRDGACEAPTRIVVLPGGSLEIAPLDWESAGTVKPRRIDVDPFRIDAFEVTEGRWGLCAAARACPERPSTEPGLPVTGVDALEARRFCRFAGGDLPTSDQWTFAAAGPSGRRYPWGETGAVCRRAAFGLERGPCGEGAVGPDLAGARPTGATPEGIHDLAGNVAEWTLGADGTFEIRGGGFADEAAATLRTWSARREDRTFRSPGVGLRCAYPP